MRNFVKFETTTSNTPTLNTPTTSTPTTHLEVQALASALSPHDAAPTPLETPSARYASGDIIVHEDPTGRYDRQVHYIRSARHRGVVKLVSVKVPQRHSHLSDEEIAKEYARHPGVPLEGYGCLAADYASATRGLFYKGLPDMDPSNNIEPALLAFGMTISSPEVFFTRRPSLRGIDSAAKWVAYGPDTSTKLIRRTSKERCTLYDSLTWVAQIEEVTDPSAPGLHLLKIRRLEVSLSADHQEVGEGLMRLAFDTEAQAREFLSHVSAATTPSP